MSFLIIGILTILICLIYQMKANKISKRVTTMYVIWTLIILFFSTLNLFELYEVSSNVYCMWIINILVVSFCVLIFSKKYMLEDKESQRKIVNKIENSKIIFYISIILFIVLLYYKIKYDKIIKNLLLEEIRMARFDRLFDSGVESIFYDYIIVNVLKVFLILTAILIVNGKYKNKIVIINILNLAIYTMIGYGRMAIFEFAIYVIISYLVFSNGTIKEELNMKKIMKWSVFIILLIFIGAAVTIIRLKGIGTLKFNNVLEYGIGEQLKQIYVYFTGGFRTLDKFIKEGFYSLDGLTITRLTFGGIEDILGLFLNNIGYNFKTINSLVGPITQTEVQVGESIYMNAFYTCIMNYFGDLEYAGIIIYPIIHGVFIAYSINNYIKKKNLISYVLLSYVVMNALCSIYRWNYQSGSTTFTLLIMIILNMIIKRRKKSEDTLDSKHDISISSKANRT